jgi:hypothetical protein
VNEDWGSAKPAVTDRHCPTAQEDLTMAGDLVTRMAGATDIAAVASFRLAWGDGARVDEHLLTPHPTLANVSETPWTAPADTGATTSDSDAQGKERQWQVIPSATPARALPSRTWASSA